MVQKSQGQPPGMYIYIYKSSVNNGRFQLPTSLPQLVSELSRISGCHQRRMSNFGTARSPLGSEKEVLEPAPKVQPGGGFNSLVFQGRWPPEKMDGSEENTYFL